MKHWKTLFWVLLLLGCEHRTPVTPNGEQQLPQWPMVGKNLRHTANAGDPVEYYRGPQEGKIVWSSLKNYDGFWCTPSIGTDGTVYIASGSEYIYADSGFVYAVNPTGSVKWQFKTQRPNYGSGALGQDGTYFYGSSDHYLYAIDLDGNLKWKQQIGYFNYTRPAITKNGEVIVAAGAGVTALHPETGEVLWFYEKANLGDFAISIDNAGDIYTGMPNSVLALTATGTKKWEFPVRFGPQEVMIGRDGTLYFQVEKDSLFYALEPDGTLKWTFKLPGETRHNSPCIDPAGAIYVLCVDNAKIYKLKPDGKKEAEIDLLKATNGIAPFTNDSIPILDASATIFLAMGLTFNDNFYAIEQNGEVKWSVTVDHPGVLIFPQPAISPDGTLYIAGDFTLNVIK